jgi:hypothetical protein
MPKASQAKLTVIAEFPERFFLENLAIRADGSMLVTVQNRKELWFVPASRTCVPVRPIPLDRFEFNTGFIVERRPDRFLLGVADVYKTHEARLYEIDLNGACLVTPNLLMAAGMAELIWRVDPGDNSQASARIWLEHDSMKNRPGEMKPEQPGTNGVQFDSRTGYL